MGDIRIPGLVLVTHVVLFLLITGEDANLSNISTEEIGIEVIPENTDGRFSDASIETLKTLLDKYFPRLPLVRHYDWTGKDCPKYYVDSNNWKDLLEKLGRG